MERSLSLSQHSEAPGPDILLCRECGTRQRTSVRWLLQGPLPPSLSSPVVTQAEIPSLCILLIFHQPPIDSDLPAGTLRDDTEQLDCIIKIGSWKMITLPLPYYKRSNFGRKQTVRASSTLPTSFA